MNKQWSLKDIQRYYQKLRDATEYQHTFVCFTDRYTTRGVKNAEPHCPACRKELVRLPLDRRIPKKRNSKGWNKLEAKFG